MTVLLLTCALFFLSMVAGFLGSLTGLGGGGILIPMLTLIFKVDFHYAIGTSLVSAIATSSGAAAAYVKEGISNIRLGIFLELATTMGAVTGAFLSAYTSTDIIAVVFGCVLLLSSLVSIVQHHDHVYTGQSSYLARYLKLNNSFPAEGKQQPYTVKNVIGGFFTMNIAGVISGLVGIGSGALKVIAMDNIMRVPFKVSTTTSNFMIGVTAAASVGIYLKKGYIDPGLTMPVVLGVLVGAFIGSKVLFVAKSRTLKIIFAILLLFLAAQMIYNGITHKL